jgi:hypothetical protein
MAIVAIALLMVNPAAGLLALEQGVAQVRSWVAGGYSALFLAIGAVLLVLAGLLLFLEVRRPRRLTVRVMRSGGTSVELTTESVERGLEYHIAQVAGIRQVRPVVTSTGRAVKVLLELETDPTAGVSAKSEELIGLTREVIEGKLGLRLAALSVNMRQGAYGGGVAPVQSRPVPDLPHEGLPNAPAGGSLQ